MRLGVNTTVCILFLILCLSFLVSEPSNDAIENFISTLKAFLNHSKVLDVVLLIRNSNKVTRPDLDVVENFMKNLLDPHINDQLRAAIVTYNTNTTLYFNNIHNDSQVTDKYKCLLFEHISSSFMQTSPDDFTNTHKALEEAEYIFTNARTFSRKLVLLLTDSAHNVGPPPASASQSLQALSWQENSSHDEVVIFTLGIQEASLEELQSIATDLPHHAVLFDSYKQLDVQRRKLFVDQIETNWAPIGNNSDDLAQKHENNKSPFQTPKKCGKWQCGGAHSTCVCGRDTGEYVCTCDLGHERVDSSCQPCQVGYFRDSMETLSCKACPQNATTLSTGCTSSAACVPKPGFSKCPPAPAVPNSISYFVSTASNTYTKVAPTGVSCESVTDGGSCYYECREGFSMQGSSYIRCQRGGVWKGKEPTCEVIECKKIALKKLSQLQVRVRYLNGSNYNSVLQVTCLNPAHVVIGASMWPCNKFAVWKKPDNFQCKEVFCSKLEVPEHSKVMPEECTRTQLPLNTTCSVQCISGFVLQNPSNFTCTFDGKTFWKSLQTPYCQDIKPPVVECLSEIRIEVWKVPLDGVYVNVSLENANISDNSGDFKAKIIGLPQGNKFKKGSTVLTYFAVDSSNHSGICHQNIIIQEKTARALNCPKSQTIQIQRVDRKAIVKWEEPRFEYSNGTEAAHTCSLESGRLFQYGIHVVRCHVVEYPGSFCEFNINVSEPSCELPNDLPLNGHLKCESNRGRVVRTCLLQCVPGYETIPGTSSSFECDWKGLWNVPSPWPDCFKVRKSPNQELTMAIDFEMTKGNCGVDKNKIFEKINEFMQPFINPNDELSREAHVVNIKEWNTKCVEDDSESDKTRKRRSVEEGIERPDVNETKVFSESIPAFTINNSSSSLKWEKSSFDVTEYMSHLLNWAEDLTGSLTNIEKTETLKIQKSVDFLVEPRKDEPDEAKNDLSNAPLTTQFTMEYTEIRTLTSESIETTALTFESNETVALTTENTVFTATISTTSASTEFTTPVAQQTSSNTEQQQILTLSTKELITETLKTQELGSDNYTKENSHLQSTNKINEGVTRTFLESDKQHENNKLIKFDTSVEFNSQKVTATHFLQSNEVRGVVGEKNLISFIIIFEIKYLDKTMYITTKEMEENAEKLIDNLYELEWFDEEWSIDSTPIHMTTKLIDIQKNLIEINCSTGEQKVSSSCYLCVQGTYLNSTSLLCDWCPESSYQDEPGSLDCIPCFHNTITLNPKSRTKRDCVAMCNLGYFSTTGRQPCQPCPVGSYQNLMGQSACIACSPGSSTLSNASVDANSCVEVCKPNQESPTGLQPCHECAMGFYTKLSGQIFCQQCPSTSHEDEPVSSYCPKKVECKDTSCNNRGYCLEWEGGLYCECDDGYVGRRCEDEADECVGVVCENNGTCIDQHASFECACLPQFRGKFCDLDVDECLNKKACMNGGSCINLHGGYQCLCQDGYTGFDCSVDVDDCAGVDCGGGTCVDALDSFSCLCPPGLTGVLCDTSIDICTLEACQNGGTCVANGSTRTCHCPVNFVGSNCETEVGFCSTNPCGSNASCISHHSGPQCICPLGFIGKDCSQETSPNFDLLFFSRLPGGYASVPVWKSTKELSVCVWIRSNDMQNYGTVWSYEPEVRDAAAPKLYDYGNLKFKMGRNTISTGLSLNNGNWHDVCVAWRSLEGLWSVYVNGTKVGRGKGLNPNGTLEKGRLILGQDIEDAVSKRKRFVGEMSGLVVQDEFMNASFLEDLHQEGDKCSVREGSVLSWTAVLEGLKGDVRIRSSSLCKSNNQCFSSDECASDAICIAEKGVKTCKECSKDLWTLEEEECQKRQVACTSSPCQNDGVCEATSANREFYVCRCVEGYYGKLCAHKEDYTACDDELCLNGKCKTIGANKVECQCEPGWIGRRCQISYTSPCTNHSCPSHQTCIITEEDKFSCVSLTPFWTKPAFQIVLAAVIASVICLVICFFIVFCCLKKFKKSRVNRASDDIPLQVSNPCYPDLSLFTQSTDTLQESYYCEPREIMPYATSEDSERESDVDEVSGHLRGRYNRGWTSRQNIPLPEEPEDESCKDFCKLNHAFRNTPPPPYFPSRGFLGKRNSMQKISIPSTSNEAPRHDYENDGFEKYQAPASNCYFLPLNDDDAKDVDNEAYLVPSTESLAHSSNPDDGENEIFEEVKDYSVEN